MRTGGDENIHGKEANCSYLTVPKLDNFKNEHGEKSEIIIHLAKKKKLRQEQEKATKTNKHQNNSKQKKAKLKPKQPVKAKKQKKQKNKLKQNTIFKERN